MNIVVLHGDDTAKSYLRLTKFIEVAKKRSWEIVKIDPKIHDLPEVIVSSSLFEKEKLVVLEGAKNLKKSDIKWLKEKSKNYSSTLVIYNEGLILKSLIKDIPVTKLEEFKLPRLVFKFLDSIYPGNAAVSLRLLEEVLKEEPPEMIFAILGRQLRDLYWVINDSTSLNYPSWRIARLKSQGDKFKDGSLEDLINSLAKIDIKVKTSQLTLRESLDFIIATKLE